MTEKGFSAFDFIHYVSRIVYFLVGSRNPQTADHFDVDLVIMNRSIILIAVTLLFCSAIQAFIPQVFYLKF